MASLRSARVFGLGLLLALGWTGVSQAEPGKGGDAASALEAGRAHRRAGNTKDATAELRRATSLAGADREIVLRANYELARTAIDRRDFGQAMAQCRVLGQKPGGAALGHACAAEAFMLWRRGGEAMEEVKKALAKEPRLYEGKLAEGRARLFEMNDTQAEAALREAAAIKPDSIEPHLALADLHALFGKTDLALADLREALKRDPRSPEAHFGLGKLLAPAEAATHLETALRERSTFGEALVRLAEVQIALGQLEAARTSAQRALKTDPNDASMRLVVGRVALAEGKPEVAIAEAKAALAVLANLGSAKLLIADAYAKQNEIDLAIEAYQAAYGLDRTDPAPLIRASAACVAQGRSTTGRAFAVRATQDFPLWSPAWLALGDAAAAQNEVPAAKQAYEQAVAKARGQSDATEARRRLDKLK